MGDLICSAVRRGRYGEPVHVEHARRVYGEVRDVWGGVGGGARNRTSWPRIRIEYGCSPLATTQIAIRPIDRYPIYTAMSRISFRPDADLFAHRLSCAPIELLHV